jgi:renalase
MKAAIVGAGLAGLRLANRLRDTGAELRVFEKARGPSGRLATRRTVEGQFDHGDRVEDAYTSAEALADASGVP